MTLIRASRAALAASVSLTMLAGVAAPALAQTGRPVQTETIAERGKPALIVTVVIDQFSANLFNQYRSLYTSGLKTLSEQGLVSTNGYQTHGITMTCSGHATVLTGAHPARNGIAANDWIDTKTGKYVYCLSAPQNRLAHGQDSDNGPVGPGNMQASTLGDWLKDVSPESRIFAVSGKDRGAIALNGHKGDGAYWLTNGFGFTTYVEPGQKAEERLAPVAAVNTRMAERFAKTPVSWTYTNEDCRRREGEWAIGNQVFHSTVPPTALKMDTSPVLDELTMDGALELLETQQLGRRGVTDMLGVSLSATDRVGHTYGTQGPEMCEQMLALDHQLGRLLDKLSTIPGGVVLALTADHGGSDFPERTSVNGYPTSGRFDPTVLPRINAELKTRFNLSANPLVSSAKGFVVVDGNRIALPEPLRSQVIAAAVELLNEVPQIAMAVSRDELLAEPLPNSDHPDELSLRERLRLSAVAERAPDIMRADQPGVTGSGRVGATIANHGSPWDYDRRVPIIFWWPNAIGQERFYPIRTVDMAPTLANLIDVKPAAEIDGRCLDLPEFTTGKCRPE